MTQTLESETAVLRPEPAMGPPLLPIPGPSAFGGTRERFVDLLWLLSVSEFRLQYANTGLGFLWTIIRPLVFFGVIFLILRGVLRFGSNIPDYGLILVLNLILFTYFQETTSRAVRSISAKEGMIRKMQFPRIIVPLSVSLSAAFTLLLNLLALLPMTLLFGLEPHWTWLLFPIVLVLLIGFTTMVSMALSVLFVRSEDIGQAWALASRILFYATPVLFPIETFARIGDVAEIIVAANPLAPLLEQARVWVIDPSAPNGVDQVGWFFGLIVPATLFVATCAFGWWVFKRDAPRVAEAL
jgi:ABC-2 type transport system permease protein